MYRHAARLALISVGLIFGAALPGYCLGQASSGQGALPQAASAYWSPTGNLNTPRNSHTATLLPSGKVLVVGGFSNALNTLDSAELYDTTTGKWNVTGSLNSARVFHTATLLQNGKVLIVGGFVFPVIPAGLPNFTPVPSPFPLGSSELYDPATGTWSPTGSLAATHAGHTATLLPNGKVLIVGGVGGSDDFGMLHRAELYDPTAGTWGPAGSPISHHFAHTATLLQSGNVLIAGGRVDAQGDFDIPVPSRAELYDPVSDSWREVDTAIIVGGHTATLLPNGKVLMAGGSVASPITPRGAELYDPSAETLSYTGNLAVGRYGHTATLLPNDQVLVAGGDGGDRAELYDPDTAIWTSTSILNAGRFFHTATLLPNGNVLAAGGRGAQNALNSAELYQQPANNSYRMTGLFSDQAGLYQYIQLQNLAAPTQPNHFAGQTLTLTTRTGVVKSFVFPNDPLTTTQPLCIATANVLPGASGLDFVIPDAFIPTDGGTINFVGVDSWTFGPLPADGHSVLLRNGMSPSGVLTCSTIAFFLAVPQDPVIEYYNAALDHYFISASQPDIDALDSGRIPGWKRTGYSFAVWITRYVDPGGQFGAPPNVVDVCRIYIPPVDGDSHFFSASASECAAAQAQHPEFVLETTSAFLVTLPNPQTGACPADQIAVYRLWNGRADSNHRYTSSIAVRDQMKARGYIAEGYGPDAVAMCAGGNI